MPPNLVFPKSKRLTKTSEFDQVRKEGAKIRGSLVSIGVLRAGAAKNFRAGFITSRKVGAATIRNRVRRRLREIVRRNQQRLAGGIWVVTIASPRAARAGYAELEGEWLRLAERASILAA
jgi:ribonuclease P protein component